MNPLFLQTRQFFDLEKPIFSYLNLAKIPRKLFNYCPSSAPFLSGDTFRSLSNLQYDNIRKCKASDIKENFIVFVSSWLLEEFANTILKKIKLILF